jgi:exodeoxyribonuclease VII small subunit
MAKTKPNEAKKNSSAKKTFEERLERLEELGDEIRKTDIPLEDAIKAYEEGIKLVRTLEKELEKIESRIEILRNGTTGDDDSEEERTDDSPILGLFDDEE